VSEQIELLRRGYELLNRDGVAGIADMLDRDFEVQTAPELPEAGTYRGLEAFGTLIETLSEPFEDLRVEPLQFIEVQRDLVVVPLHIIGRGKLSGVALDSDVLHVWTLRDQKALRLRVFTTLAQVMTALMRDAYEAFNTGGFDGIASFMHPDAELHEEPEMPDARVWHGREQVAKYFAESVVQWETFELEVRDVVQVAEQVIVVTGVMRARGGLSGAEVESRFGHVYELENWRARRITFYFDPDRALEAARSLARPGEGS
jgi:ketosteroid isomerase-like protein